MCSRLTSNILRKIFVNAWIRIPCSPMCCAMTHLKVQKTLLVGEPFFSIHQWQIFSRKLCQDTSKALRSCFVGRFVGRSTTFSFWAEPLDLAVWVVFGFSLWSIGCNVDCYKRSSSDVIEMTSIKGGLLWRKLINPWGSVFKRQMKKYYLLANQMVSFWPTARSISLGPIALWL